MASFQTQVMGLTSLSISSSGTNPTEAQLTQFLTDGAKEVINSLPGHLLPLCASSNTFTSGSADTLVTGKILNVFKRYALSYPHINFELSNNKKMIFNLKVEERT